MYIIERLKSDYPVYTEELDRYNQFLHRHGPDETIRKIYDDQKPSFRWVDEAFRHGPGTAGYNKSMALYQIAVGFDRDFLVTLMPDAEGMTVDELRRKFLGENYSEEKERKLLEKIKGPNV